VDLREHVEAGQPAFPSQFVYACKRHSRPKRGNCGGSRQLRGCFGSAHPPSLPSVLRVRLSHH
jgi:hypothetical protein